MKKLTYLVTLAGSLFIATSCVDLNQEPQSFITEEDYIASMDQSALESAVSALYKDLWANNYGFNCITQRIQVCADEITYRAAKVGNQLANYERLSPSISDNTKDYDQSWAYFYTVINNANKLINKTAIPESEEAAKKFEATLAEAYFLRGLSYFYLVRMYGDIPLIMGDEDLAKDAVRTPVEEIYDKAIVPSLKYAVEKLPETPRAGNSSTPTKWAAETCLADVYITMAGWPLKKKEYYAEAAKLAKDVLDNNKYHKEETNYEDLWKENNKNSNEFMFCLHHSQANNVMASNYGKSYYPVNYYDMSDSDDKKWAVRSGWADYYARKEAYLNYPNDKRKEWNFMTKWRSSEAAETGTTSDGKPIYGEITWEESSDGLPCISKYYDYDQGYPADKAQANGVTSIYRLADAKLLYAEASTRATESVTPQAIEAVRSLQERAGYDDAGIKKVPDDVNYSDFLKIVSNERSYELYAEMRRWFELVRTEQVSVKRAETWNGSLFQTQGHYYFPIPSQQILLTGWKNNKGY